MNPQADFNHFFRTQLISESDLESTFVTSPPKEPVGMLRLHTRQPVGVAGTTPTDAERADIKIESRVCKLIFNAA